jgi:FdhD protein
MNEGMARVAIQRFGPGPRGEAEDTLAVEEPLELRLDHAGPEGPEHRSLAITMRTPGHDEELAAGFLFTEGLLRTAADLRQVRLPRPNVVRVTLADHVAFDPHRLERHFYAASSCGICGKASIEALQVQRPFPLPTPGSGPRIAADLLHGLPERLREAQHTFGLTGGLHAAAIFDAEGRLLSLREDVGRHNALDKVIGRALMDGELPLRDRLLVVSGRASFELVQKAAMAGLPLLAAVGAPSTLAVQLAEEWGLTLIGFLRDGRFNVYSGAWRLA